MDATFWGNITEADTWLDENVSQEYKDQPLAQDWARVSKAAEEAGEVIKELISFTGQNPRKNRDLSAHEKMLAELADVSLTAIYAIQHFTKDAKMTQALIEDRSEYHLKRIGLR